MKSISDAALLRLWEGGLRSHSIGRALLALSAAMPEVPYQRLADWPLGRRNQALIELRCQFFGNQLAAWVACPRCDEKLEFAIDGRTLMGPANGPDQKGANDAIVVVNGQSYRLPSSRDLVLAASENDPRRAALRILKSCLTGSEQPDSAADRPVWSDEEIERIGERMALADPLAEIRLTLHCPNCEQDWEETLDIVSFVWAEIDARARRLFVEIHTLASAYGWTETEVLALGADRRARYVEMVRS
jgi:hypothetical protein